MISFAFLAPLRHQFRDLTGWRSLDLWFWQPRLCILGAGGETSLPAQSDHREGFKLADPKGQSNELMFGSKGFDQIAIENAQWYALQRHSRRSGVATCVPAMSSCLVMLVRTR